MRKGAAAMPMQTTPVFFMVRFKRYEGGVQNDTALADIIRSYAKARKYASGRISDCKNGLDISVRYKIGKRNFFWCKKTGKTVLQETFKQNYGYCIITRNLNGEIISKARYNNKYHWLQTAYYCGDTELPQAVLKPMDNEDGLVLLKYVMLTGKYRRIELRPFPYYSGTVEQSLLNTIVGEPQVFARTNCGSFCYCPNSELESRTAVINDLDTGIKSLVPKWGTVKPKNVEFNYIENDIPKVLPKPQKPLLPPQDEKEPQKPKKYSVAAKGLKGKAELSGKLPKNGGAKRIVISAKEDYTYFGNVVNGLREGRGRTQMANGCTAYEGDYINDKRDGFGTYYYKSGKLCYVGSWKENKRSGTGIAFSSKDGSIFVGSWKDNIPTGSGAAFDSDGNLIYTGEWKNGMRHGTGTEFKNGKIVFRGEFRNDKYYS